MRNDLPKQVRNFLRADSYKPENVFYHARSFSPFSENRDVQNIAKRALLDKIIPYYSKRGLETGMSVYNFLVEPLKNANFHGGGRDRDIRFELFLTPLVLAASYRDGGKYFMRQEVKEAWESRTIFPEIHKADSDEIGFGAGTGMIYSMADFIYVDTFCGTLYTGMMAKKFCG